MNRANQDIRNAISSAGLKIWQVADRYGINDGNFTRLLRKELTPENKERIFAIIKELKAEIAAEIEA